VLSSDGFFARVLGLDSAGKPTSRGVVRPPTGGWGLGRPAAGPSGLFQRGGGGTVSSATGRGVGEKTGNGAERKSFLSIKEGLNPRGVTRVVGPVNG